MSSGSPSDLRDLGMQERILGALVSENGPMTIRHIGDRLSVHPSAVAVNLGQLQASDAVRRVEGEEIVARYEITPPGIMRALGRRSDVDLPTHVVNSWEAIRARSMPSFLRYYNRCRPHGSLGDQPPISRVHSVRGQDI